MVLSLGDWKFICFVESVNLTKVFQLNPLHCQIYFLAMHRNLKKLRLMVLDKDPWNSQNLPSVNVIQTCAINLPDLTLEKLKYVHLLVKESAD